MHANIARQHVGRRASIMRRIGGTLNAPNTVPEKESNLGFRNATKRRVAFGMAYGPMGAHDGLVDYATHLDVEHRLRHVNVQYCSAHARRAMALCVSKAWRGVDRLNGFV
jgi:hypothetical protein